MVVQHDVHWGGGLAKPFARVADAVAFARLAAATDVAAYELLDGACFPIVDLEYDAGATPLATLAAAYAGVRALLEARGMHVAAALFCDGSRDDAAYPSGRKASYHIIFKTTRPLVAIKNMAVLQPDLRRLCGTEPALRWTAADGSAKARH